MAAYTTIDDAGSFCNPVIYTGNGTAYGSGGNAITGVGFQPDFTWIKSRTTAEEHVLTDAVRGVTKIIRTTGTYAESTAVEGLNVFGSDGFTIGSSDQFNTNTEDYVSWNWKMGTTSGIDTTGATITPSAYSFDQTAGQSVIAYTGTGVAATVPHGLGVAPSLIITKSLVATQEWCVYHVEMSAAKYMFLNETGQQATSSAYWNDVEPTSVLFSIGTAGPTNSSSAMIAYCFAEKQGYSKMADYIGNGDADGPFVYTGFRPAWIMCKYPNGAGYDWIINDDKRPGYNPNQNILEANRDRVENTNTGFKFDILSNGFKPRAFESNVNNDAYQYLYTAFAESPFVNSLGVPTNAR